MGRNSRKRKATNDSNYAEIDIPESHHHHSATLSPRAYNKMSNFPHGIPPLKLGSSSDFMEEDLDDVGEEEELIEKIWSYVDKSLAPIQKHYIRTLKNLTSQALDPLILGHRGRHYKEVARELEYLAAKTNNDVSDTRTPRINRRRRSLPSRDDISATILSPIESVTDFDSLVYGYDDDAHSAWLEDMKAKLQLSVKTNSVNKKLRTDSHYAASPLEYYKICEDIEPAEPRVPVDTWHPAYWGRNYRLESLKDLDTTLDHPAAVKTKTTFARWEWEALGNVPEDYYGTQLVDCDDEISMELMTLDAALRPCWNITKEKITELLVLSDCEAHVESIIERESLMAKTLESYYRLLFPEDNPERRYFRVRSSPRDIVAYVTRHATSQSAAVIAHATSFALTLKLGDEVDVLDRNGVWNSGVVVDMQKDGDKLLRYVKIHLVKWGSECDEWISTFGGRILPAGMCISTEEETQKALEIIEEEKSSEADSEEKEEESKEDG